MMYASTKIWIGIKRSLLVHKSDRNSLWPSNRYKEMCCTSAARTCAPESVWALSSGLGIGKADNTGQRTVVTVTSTLLEPSSATFSQHNHIMYHVIWLCFNSKVTAQPSGCTFAYLCNFLAAACETSPTWAHKSHARMSVPRACLHQTPQQIRWVQNSKDKAHFYPEVVIFVSFYPIDKNMWNINLRGGGIRHSNQITPFNIEHSIQHLDN